MAGTALMNVSKDENERAVFRARRKRDSDLESNLRTAFQNGEQIGLEKGFVKGEEIGLEKGEERRAIAIAIKLLKRSRPIDEIIEDTGLSFEEVKKLERSLQT